MTSTPAAPGVIRQADVRHEPSCMGNGLLNHDPAAVGTYLLLRIDNREAGRKLVRRLLAVIESARSSSDPARNAWVSVAFTYQGLKALGVPQDSLGSFAPEFRQGMAVRAAELGDVGDSSPEKWEKPLGSPEVHVAVSVLSPDLAVDVRPPVGVAAVESHRSNAVDSRVASLPRDSSRNRRPAEQPDHEQIAEANQHDR